MTQLKNKHPDAIPSVSFTDEGRKIDFQKDCMGEVSIFRKVNDGDFELVAKNVRAPYVDKEEFGAGTHLIYSVRMQGEGEEKSYDLPVNLR